MDGEETWPRLDPVKPEDERFSITVDLLEVVLRARALENEIAPSYLGTRADIAQLIEVTVGPDKGVRSKKRQAEPLLLSGWRRGLVGDELVAFLEGRASLKIDEATGFVHVMAPAR